MSHRLSEVVSSLRSRGQIGLSPFLMAGDGGLDRTLRLLHAMQRAQVSCCELGLPFGDPIADGPALEAAAKRALDHRTSLPKVLKLVRTFREQGGQVPIMLMSYLNPLLAYGLEGLCKDAKDVGIDGLIVPDLPLCEAQELCARAQAQDLGMVFFAAPTSTSARIQAAAKASSGFLYVVGRVGVTGAATSFDDQTLQYLAQVKATSGHVARAVGFGISQPSHIQAVAPYADLAIVGTALAKTIEGAGVDDARCESLAGELMASLVRAAKDAARS